MACSQTRISYNLSHTSASLPVLWLVLRRGLVTIKTRMTRWRIRLWLVLRRGLVTIFIARAEAKECCGLFSDAD